jgi:phage gp46-like protein
VTDATLNTAIVISLFTDRYDSTLNKGGWWGDERADNPYPLGSRLWTLSKNKVDSQTLLSAEDYAREALQWMLHDNLLKSLTINAKWERAKTETITYRIALLIEATTHPTSHYAKSFNTRYLL